jgi:hypothetical protein
MMCLITKTEAMDDWRKISLQNGNIQSATDEYPPGVPIPMGYGVPMSIGVQSALNCWNLVFQQTIRNLCAKIRWNERCEPNVPYLINNMWWEGADGEKPRQTTRGSSAQDTASQPGRPAAGCMTPGVLRFDAPSNFITSPTIRYLEMIPGGQRWIDMVKAYLQLERLPIPKGVRIFFFIITLY